MSSDQQVSLSVKDLNVAYRQQMILWDVSVDFLEHSLFAIVGPNGAGKSTLLKAALGLIPKISGSVTFWGKPLSEVRQRVAYVPQRESVDWDFPIDACGVVAMGLFHQLGWFKPVGKKERTKAEEALDRVGLFDYRKRQISELSGGQQQRVFLARALVQNADLYLMDEPFASVDAATEQAIVNVLHDMKSEGKSVVCIHHDLETVRDFFDRIVLLNMKVVAAGEMDEVLTHDHLAKTYGGKHHLLDRVTRKIRGNEIVL